MVVVVGLVVVVVVLVVVVMVFDVVVVVVVMGVVVLVVLRVRPQDPLALRRDKEVVHHFQPLGMQVMVDSWGSLGLGLTEPVVEGSHVPGLVWPALVVCGSRMAGGFEMGKWRRVRTVLCRVAPSLVAVCAGGRGERGTMGGVSVTEALQLLLMPPRLCQLGVLVLVLVVLAMLVVVVVVLVLLRMVLLLALGLRVRYRVGLGFGNRLEVGEDVVPEVWGDRFQVVGARGLLPGCWNRPCGSPRGADSRLCGCAFGFGPGLVDEGDSEGRGGGGGP